MFDEDGNTASITHEAVAVAPRREFAATDNDDELDLEVQEVEEVQEADHKAAPSTEAMAHRAVPSHFYPEAKASSKLVHTPYKTRKTSAPFCFLFIFSSTCTFPNF